MSTSTPASIISAKHFSRSVFGPFGDGTLGSSVPVISATFSSSNSLALIFSCAPLKICPWIVGQAKLPGQVFRHSKSPTSHSSLFLFHNHYHGPPEFFEKLLWTGWCCGTPRLCWISFKRQYARGECLKCPTLLQEFARTSITARCVSTPWIISWSLCAKQPKSGYTASLIAFTMFEALSGWGEPALFFYFPSFKHFFVLAANHLPCVLTWKRLCMQNC